MILITPDGEAASAEDILSATETLFREAEAAFVERIQKIQAGEALAKDEAVQETKRLKDLLTLFIKERQAVAERRKKEAGVHGEFAIDFGQARAEIRGRLDRLRAAGNTGKIPE